MGDDDIANLSATFGIDSLEKDDPPKCVQEYEGQSEKGGNDKEVGRIAFESNRTGSGRIGKNVDRRESTAHHTESESAD